MIINLTENQSYDLSFLEQYQCSTAGNKITFHQELLQADIDAINLHINEMTQAERDFANAKKVKLQEASSECEKALSVITNQYPEAEMKTWAQQLTNAEAYVANPIAGANESYLQPLATARGVTVLEIANLIIDKGFLFDVVSVTEIAKRQAMEKAATNALTIDELKLVTY